MTNAETAKEVRDIKKEGAQDKMDANYPVAAQKCDALSGNAKGQFNKNQRTCIATAKAGQYRLFHIRANGRCA